MFDVIVVGGGSAGLSAALTLGRSRRRTLLCDAGSPRNAASHAAHTFFTRDGAPPSELIRIGREQLRPYTDVEARDVAVLDATPYAGGEDGGGFEVTLADGARERARMLILATGMVDVLPEIPGFRELWGAGVYPCPFCDGWEVRDQPLAVYNRSAIAAEHALMISNWSRDLTLLTDGPAQITDEGRRLLAARGIPVREERLARLEGSGGALERIIFENGETLERRAMFGGVLEQRQRSDLPLKLGCTLKPSGVIAVDEMGFTGVPGLYAAGDLIREAQQIAFAVADGLRAAAAMNHLLIQRESRDERSQADGAQ